MTTTVERILDLVAKSEFNAKQILNFLELSNSSITDWKRGKAKPSTEAIIKLSNFFNVSTDYLLIGYEKEKAPLSRNEKEWLDLYHQLPDEGRIECTGFIKGYLAAHTSIKPNTTERKKVMEK